MGSSCLAPSMLPVSGHLFPSLGLGNFRHYFITHISNSPSLLLLFLGLNIVNIVIPFKNIYLLFILFGYAGPSCGTQDL